MINKYLGYILTLIVLLSSCKDNGVPSRTVFKFTLGTALQGQDLWVVLHDNENGELIDYRQVNLATTEVFDSNKPIATGKIDITVLRAANDGTIESYVDVYKGIEIGTQWSFATGGRNYELPNSGGNSGAYTLTINGLPAVRSINVSDEFGDVTDGIPGTFVNSTYTLVANVHANSKGKQLVSVDTGIGNRKYAWIESVSLAKDVTVAFTSFKDFDHNVKLSFPKTNAVHSYVIGYDAQLTPNYSSFIAGRLEPFQIQNTTITELNLGFLDAFPQYTIDIDLYPYRYQSLGAAPTAIEFVDANDYKTSSPSIDAYSITTSKSYNYRITNYQYTHENIYSSINYHAAEGDEKHHEALPPELTSKYSIYLDQVEYTNTIFVVKGEPYVDFITSTFVNVDYLTKPYARTLVYSEGQ